MSGRTYSRLERILKISSFRSGWSPLLLAASNGHLDLVKIFLDVNARVDVFDQEARSALHLAAESGNADICEMLLAKNAYVNSKTKAGWTPLHYVAFNGFNELIHPLVTKHNAAIDATSMVSHCETDLTDSNCWLLNITEEADSPPPGSLCREAGSLRHVDQPRGWRGQHGRLRPETGGCPDLT